VRVTAVNPSTGTTAGGTVVTVTGGPFLTGAACLFGATAGFTATVDSSTVLRCASPSGSSGTVSVRISNNNGNEYSNDRTIFTYTGMLVYHAVVFLF
jgi:hypothetical protein